MIEAFFWPIVTKCDILRTNNEEEEVLIAGENLTLHSPSEVTGDDAELYFVNF